MSLTDNTDNKVDRTTQAIIEGRLRPGTGYCDDTYVDSLSPSMRNQCHRCSADDWLRHNLAGSSTNAQSLTAH